MALFNSTYSKITSGSFELVCNNSLIKYELNINDSLEHYSAINGKRNFIDIGEHGNININFNLDKFSDPYAKYREIINLNHKLVKFYPNYSASAFKNTASADINFFVSNVSPYYVENTLLLDAVNIYLKSTEYIDLIKTISGSV